MPDDYALPYWGVIGPISQEVIYGDEQWTAEWHVLDGSEFDTFLTRLQRVPPPLMAKASKTITIAMALRKVNGRTVTFNGEDDEEEFLSRMAWLDRYPVPFIDAVYHSYERALELPALKRQQKLNDPNSTAPLSGLSGASSATPATSEGDSSPHPTGPIPSFTLR